MTNPGSPLLVDMLHILPLVFLAACALDPEPTSTAEQDLTANEVDSTWFSDAAFTHEVGESDLYCTGGKSVHGTIGTRYVVRFTYPCNGAGGHPVQCYEYVPPGSYSSVECPAGLF